MNRRTRWNNRIDTRKGNKTYSFREPRPNVLESDKEEISSPSPNPSDYDLELLSQSKNPLDPETPPQPTYQTFIPPEMSIPTEMENTGNPFGGRSSWQTQALAATSATTKKKLRPPTPFSGKREDLRKFLQELKIFLLGNTDAYPSDLDKILFVLSYMSEGDANSWKEEFFDSAEQIAAQTGTTLTLGTYKNFTTEIEKDFSPYDAPKDAIYEMKELKIHQQTLEIPIGAIVS